MKLANILKNIRNILEEHSIYLADIAWLFEVSSLPSLKPSYFFDTMGFSNE